MLISLLVRPCSSLVIAGNGLVGAASAMDGRFCGRRPALVTYASDRTRMERVMRSGTTRVLREHNAVSWPGKTDAWLNRVASAWVNTYSFECIHMHGGKRS